MDTRKIGELTIDEFVKILNSQYDVLLSYEQVSIMLRCDRAKVASLVHSGKLKAIKGFGTNVKFIHETEVKKHIERIGKIVK